MSVKLIGYLGYGGYPSGSIVEFPASTEAALIASGQAIPSTGPATPGPVTTNAKQGSVTFAAGTSSLVITNAKFAPQSLVHAYISQVAADATALRVERVIAADMTVTIYLNAAATAAVSVKWALLNYEGPIPRPVSAISDMPIAIPYMFAANRTAHCPNTSAQVTVAGNQFEANSIELISPPYETWNTVFTFEAIIYQNVENNVEIPLGNNINIEGAAIAFGGNTYPLAWGGASSTTILDGTYQHSDPVAVHLPPNTVYKLRFADNVPLNGKRPNQYLGQSTDGLNGSSTSQLARVTSGSFSVPGRATAMFGPCQIVAQGWHLVSTSPTEPAVVLNVGNSIDYGANDINTAIAQDGIFGHEQRALNDSATSTRYPSNKCSVPGTRLSNLSGSAGNFAKREAMLRDFNFPFTVISNEMAINSTATYPLAQCIAEGQAAVTYLKSLGNRRLVWSTQTPQTLMVDNSWFTNVPSQTRSTVAAHDGFDAWLLTMPPGIDAVIDCRATFQDAGNPGIWKIPPVNASNPVLTTAITAGPGTSFTTDVAFEIDDNVVIEVGSATNEKRIVWSRTGTGPYTHGCNGTSFTASHAAGVSVKANYVADGTHPTTPMSKIGATGYIAAKNANVYTTRNGVFATT